MLNCRMAFTLSFFLVLAVAACNTSDEEPDDSSDNDQDDAGDNDNADGDDDSAADDDQTDDDLTDDDTEGPPDLQVSVDPPPAGNPLARRIRIFTDRACALSGFAKTEGEPGKSPSWPPVTPSGKYHEIWFLGLLFDRDFEFTIYLAGEPENALATGSFTTPSMPRWAPQPQKLNNTPEAAADIWVAMIMNSTGDEDGDHLLDRINLVQILDRDGRPRFFHNAPDYPGMPMNQFMEGLTILSNGDLAWSNRSDVAAVTPTGDSYLLFHVQLDEPYGIPVHHQGVYWLEPERHGMVLFNLLGPGVECDLITPTDQSVGDGVIWLDAEGRETKRWTIFEIAEVVPPELLSPCSCEQSLWGPGTFDFSHANSVVSMDDGAAFLISSRNLSRLIKVDSASGEVIWQMGENLDFEWLGDEPEKDRWFFLQHDPQWLPNNHLLVFDNSGGRYIPCWINQWSRGLELEVDETAMTVRKVWDFHVPFSSANGGISRLDNGNTLIAGGWSGVITEATANGAEAWSIEYREIFLLPDIYNARPYPALWDYEDD